GLAVVDVTHDRDHRRTLRRFAARALYVGQQLGLGVVGFGRDRLVAQLLDHQHRGVVVDALGDGGHHAHLEQRLDHVAALERELRGQVGHGDRLADRHFAHHRRGRTLEPVRTGAAARLLDLATRPRLAAARVAVARAFGRAQVQLAGEARRAVVVLDARHHRVRAAVALVLGTGVALVARRRRLGVAGAMRRLARGGIGLGRGDGLFGFLAQAFGLGLLLALEFGRLIGATLVFLGQALLLGQVALARLLELAQDLGLLVVHRRGGALRGFGGGLAQRDPAAQHHVYRRAVLPAANGELLLAGAAERDLLRRHGLFGRLLVLAMGAAQEAGQLDRFGAGDNLVGIVERHARFGQLFQQLLHRRVDQGGELADGGLLRHSGPMLCLAPPRREQGKRGFYALIGAG